MDKDAGPEVGSPERSAHNRCTRDTANGFVDHEGSARARVLPGDIGENGALEGCWRAVGAKNGCAQLYAFTRFYHLFLGVNVTGVNEAEITTEIPRHRGKK